MVRNETPTIAAGRATNKKPPNTITKYWKSPRAIAAEATETRSANTPTQNQKMGLVAKSLNRSALNLSATSIYLNRPVLSGCILIHTLHNRFLHRAKRTDFRNSIPRIRRAVDGASLRRVLFCLEGRLFHPLRRAMRVGRAGFFLHVLVVIKEGFDIVVEACGNPIACAADFSDDRIVLHGFRLP